MVFHAEGDAGVRYCDDEVFVDGHAVEAYIYNQRVPATSEFKYLGVVLNSCASGEGHMRARYRAAERAAATLTS
eukprot:9874133-Karenia_brevis.AAC.1